jgi:ActR/RegA family two-component response regulator
MRILVVEDDAFKMNAIVRLVGSKATILSKATSLRSAMTALECAAFDFVVLDMAIPSHTSEVGAIDTYSQPVGGLDVLLFLSSNDRAEKIVILTQYPTVEYDRKHVRLRDFVDVLKQDDIHNVVDVLRFGDDEPWSESLLKAIGGFE